VELALLVGEALQHEFTVVPSDVAVQTDEHTGESLAGQLRGVMGDVVLEQPGQPYPVRLDQQLPGKLLQRHEPVAGGDRVGKQLLDLGTCLLGEAGAQLALHHLSRGRRDPLELCGDRGARRARGWGEEVRHVAALGLQQEQQREPLPQRRYVQSCQPGRVPAAVLAKGAHGSQRLPERGHGEAAVQGVPRREAQCRRHAPLRSCFGPSRMTSADGSPGRGCRS